MTYLTQSSMRLSIRHRLPYRTICVIAANLAAGLLLSGCGVGDWLSDEEEGARLGGSRISVLQLEQRIETDPQLETQPITLPAPQVNTEWAQAGGRADHANPHLSLPATLKEVWRVGIEGSGTESRLLSPPIVVGGRVYVLDTDFDLHALDEASGRTIWTRNMKREGQEDDAFGGGVSFGDGRIFVTTGFGEVVAVDPAGGDIVWRQRIAGPIRSAPTIVNGRVFVLTVDNQFVVLNADNRVLQWTHNGILEQTTLIGSPSPAVTGDVAIVPYSSGEIYALRVENGQQAWQENIAAVRRGESIGGLADIRGNPVVDRGVVYAVSHSGRMVAVDVRTGQRIWEQEVGGINTPWIAGDWIFLVSNENQLVALARENGRVKWITQLDRYEDPDDADDPIQWSGPVLAGGRLILVSSDARMIEVAPETGEVTQRSELPGDTLIAPVVANNTLFILTDDGDLVAYR